MFFASIHGKELSKSVEEEEKGEKLSRGSQKQHQRPKTLILIEIQKRAKH